MNGASTTKHSLPLSGIRVLDMSRVLAGPLCAMMLGDLGADVIKIERPGAGDDTRGWGPPFDDQGRSAYYLCSNRNKLSVAADLSVPADAELVRKLILEADVVVENFLPGSLDRRGVGPLDLLSAEPRLVWCTLTGFGAESPRPGYDFVVQAESGWMAITGEPDGEPMKIGVALADVIAGKDAVAAILALLTARERGTLSADESHRHVTISLLQSATAALVNVAQNVLVSGEDAGRWGNAHPNLSPYQLFHAADAPVVIAVGSDAHWLLCARALGLDDLAADEALRTNRGRLAQRARIVGAIAARVRTSTAAHWIAVLEGAGVPCGVVKRVKDAVTSAGGSAITGIPPATQGEVRLPPPLLDEHGTLVRARGWKAFENASPIVGPRSSL
ncbi:MAG TPA: CoA transferase [Gemmatimonadaceae bacterium]|nr:CoA transferase [Gemmatimonadaceae bacterium]